MTRMQGPSVQQLMETAQAHHSAGDIRVAAELYQRVLAAQPEHAEAIHLLGLIHYQTKDYPKALEMMKRSISLEPGVQYFYKNLGELYRTMGRVEESAAAFQRAIELAPGDGSAYLGLGQAQQRLERDGEAIISYAKAAELDPGDATAQLNLGVLLEREGRYGEALDRFETALKLRPDYALAHVARAFALLRRGDLRQGLEEYEWRWKVSRFSSSGLDARVPVWDGADLNGKTIVVRAEQGLGDTLHFSRYVPMVAARGGRVIFEVQPLLERLFRGQAGFGSVFAAGALLPRHDVQVPLMSLPHRFGTTLQSIPAPVPYLHADPVLVEQWRARLAGDRNVKVGLTWAGGADFPGDKRRSMALATLGPLAAASGVTFYALQVGPQACQAAHPPQGMKLIDLSADLKDFVDTAAVLTQLDLVIAVDTSIVHLAGAMGRQAWVLIPYVPEWRWFLDREDTPWYPSVRLFRQEKLDDWSGVVKRVVEALQAFSAGRSASSGRAGSS